MRWYEVAGAVLAADRATQLVTEDEITRPLREAVQRRWPNSRIAYAVGCRACISVWAGLALSSGKVPRTVSWALALSAAAGLVRTTDERIGELVTARVDGD